MALRSSACLFAVPVILLGFPQRATTSELPEKKATETAIVKVLPGTWDHQRTATGMLLRPKQQPLFVNTVSAAGPRPGENKDDYLCRHVVRIDYCIFLTFAPKIAPSRVQEMIAKNAAIHKKIEKIRGTETFRRSKGVPIPATPKEEQLVAEYKRLTESLNRIPYGYLGETSVYIEPTELGYARFLSKAAKAECEALRVAVAGMLIPYLGDARE